MVVFGLILIGQFLLVKNKAKNPPPKPPAATAAEQNSGPAPAAAAAPEQAPPSPQPPLRQPASASTSHKAANGEVETVVENDLYRIVFTNKGAQAKSWVLKKYKDEQGQPLDLVNAAGRAVRAASRPLHL